MMTRREAQQRAAVYGAHIWTRTYKGITQFAAILDTWDRGKRSDNARWRDDIEDAVLDCGRLAP